MNNETDMKAKQPSIAMGWLFAPLAVLLSLAAIKIVGIDYDFTLNNMMPMIVVAIASMLAVVPRMVSDNTDFSATNISLVTLLVAFVGAEALHSFASVDALACLVFALVVVLGSSLHMKERYEWFVTLTFGAVGLWMALAAAGNAFSLLPTEFTMDDDRLVSTLNLSRQATAYVFFAYLTLFVILGLLVSVMTRGVLFASGKEGWFSYLGESDGFNRKVTNHSCNIDALEGPIAEREGAVAKEVLYKLTLRDTGRRDIDVEICRSRKFVEAGCGCKQGFCLDTGCREGLGDGGLRAAAINHDMSGSVAAIKRRFQKVDSC